MLHIYNSVYQMHIQKLLLALKNDNISTKGCLGKCNGYLLSVLLCTVDGKILKSLLSESLRNFSESLKSPAVLQSRDFHMTSHSIMNC